MKIVRLDRLPKRLWKSIRRRRVSQRRDETLRRLSIEALEDRRVMATDFGDAPASYGTLLINNGARHAITNGLFLGAAVDGEADGQPNATATGDDNNGVPDDEDGVTVNGNLVPGQPASLTIVASAAGFVNAWFDLNRDGVFNNPDEQFLASVPVVAGDNNFSQLIPSNSPFGDTFARFRISTSGGLSPTGPSVDGEVEDYAVTVQTVNRFTVNSTADTSDAVPGNGVCNDGSGNCTLRAAIQETNALANLAAGPDVIIFNIVGSGPHTITPASALPTITQPVVIDATTEPDFAVTPVVELNGVSAGADVSGLKVTSSGNTIRGLTINRFTRDGVELVGGMNNVVQQNFIGTDVTGAVDLGNTRHGVSLFNSSFNTIGGGSGDGAGPAGVGNVISGNNASGVSIANAGSTGNFVQGNYIGTTAAGTGDLGNSLDGVLISNSPSNTIGGTGTGAGNVISGNNRFGVEIVNGSATGNVLQGNFIGTNAAGTGPVGNSLSGLVVYNAASNTIGGTAVGARNIISGNSENGVFLGAAGAASNLVQGNYIGTDVNGTNDLGNTLQGVFVNSASGNTIGGTVAAAGNVISGNNQNGI